MTQSLAFWQRAALLRAGFARTPSTYVSFPEPRPRGLAARGIQYKSGNFIIDGDVVEAPGQTIWDVGQDVEAHRRTAFGFAWLDDLVASGGPDVHMLVWDWFQKWLQGSSDRSAEAWRPEIVADRLIRLVNHGTVFLKGRTAEDQKLYFKTVAQHYRFLVLTWQRTEGALDRINALCALIFAAHATQAADAEVEKHETVLAQMCDTYIAEDGGIETRNPEELMQVFSLLSWTARVIDALEREPNTGISRAVARVAPCLRSLRFPNGNLAVFQLGGPGAPGRLDQALSDSRIKTPAHTEGAMGYARLSASRSTLLMDTGIAKTLPSTSAFEFSVGRHPVFVTPGASPDFGSLWAEKGRRSAGHTMLVLDRADTELGFGGGNVRRSETDDVVTLEYTHDAYLKKFGVSVSRRFTLSRDGKTLAGEERLTIPDDDSRKLFELGARGARKLRLPATLHFHLAASTEPQSDLGGSVISITLNNGQVWGFRHAGGKVTLKPSVHMAPNRLRPLATKQIQVSADMTADGLELVWLLERLS
ncbi:MAG: heparinase II/III family protein [Pseudomonadota bacterium]